MRIRVAIGLMLSSLLPLSMAQYASAKTLNDVEHIHNVKAFGKKVLLGTHHGLYQYFSPTDVRMIGNQMIDVMGLAVNGTSLFASGHPAPGSNAKNPLGLIRSDDGGKTWRSVSLSGEVDFHALETRGKIFYGVNSGNGKLLHSQDGGKSWKDLGGMKYEDFAIANPKKNQIYLTRDGKLFRGNDGLNTVSEIKGIAGVRAVEVRGSELFVAAGKSLMLSTSSGRSWEKRAAFTSEIADFSVSSNLVVVVAGNQIFTSTDGGKSFR